MKSCMPWNPAITTFHCKDKANGCKDDAHIKSYICSLYLLL